MTDNNENKDILPVNDETELNTEKDVSGTEQVINNENSDSIEETE